MHVVLTGAAGRIGRALTRELAGTHELVLIDRRPVPDRPSIVDDLSRRGRVYHRWWLRWVPVRERRWERAFAGAGAVVHLAAVANPRASWEVVLRQNICATWNVLDAAARNAVPRVVLASSCMWALGLDRPGSTVPADERTPPRPRTPYGLSKGWAEMAGRMFVDEGRIPAVVAVRVGTFSEEEPREEAMRRLWLRPGDARSILRRCLDAPLEGFHVVYAVSPEAGDLVDLTYTRNLLFWSPEGRAAEATQTGG